MKVTVPDRVFARLVDIADRQGMQVADLIADGVKMVLSMDRAHGTGRSAASIAVDPGFRQAVESGLTINRLAVRFGSSATTVRDALQMAGLETRRQVALRRGRSEGRWFSYDEVTSGIERAQADGDDEALARWVGVAMRGEVDG